MGKRSERCHNLSLGFCVLEPALVDKANPQTTVLYSCGKGWMLEPNYNFLHFIKERLSGPSLTFESYYWLNSFLSYSYRTGKKKKGTDDVGDGGDIQGRTY